jgi:hypothetical protein
MAVMASSIEAASTRRRSSSDGTGFWHTTFIGTNRIIRREYPEHPLSQGDLPELGKLYPVAFLVEQDPNSTVRAHFHEADQFQVIVAGSGRMASHEVGGVAVHYTNAHSPYGPIVAGEQGVHYFTLRNSYDRTARYMPESRPDLRQAARNFREATVAPQPPLDSAVLASVSASQTEAIAPQPDGLGAWRYRLPAGERISGPDPRTGAGQHWLVLNGELAVESSPALPRSSLVFVSPDEAPFEATAGAVGLEILCMQYPDRGTLKPAAIPT